MPHPRILFVSTYPLTRCGIATFTRSLIRSLGEVRHSTDGLGVARLRSRSDDTISVGAEVVVEAPAHSRSWPVEVARVAQGFDVMWVQHEFGIFGPDSGRRVLDLCELTTVPLVVTMHTVLAEPTPEEGEIVERLASRSERLVVMSQAARKRLLVTHSVDPAKVTVVPHGAHGFRRIGEPNHGPRPIIATWGLLGPGKGIEWGIEAMVRLRHIRPLPRYVIQGATHPNVLAAEGDAYRRHLWSLASDLGVADMVTMSSAYLTNEQLGAFIAEIDIALLPYDSLTQVTSGVLVEALGAGLPVVATAFPHAIELLSDGAGLVVPHRDPKAMAMALEGLLTRPLALRAAAMAASRMAPDLRWSSVASRSDSVANHAVAAAAASVA
ncbi:MAG: glycosyltransferase [Acidimicrobiia bacterium]